MQHNFWHERWQQNQIGFHKEAVNPFLSRFWSTLKINPSSRVFVPLCGKSNDLLWLKGLGHYVVGVELSPLAVASFFSDNNLHPAQDNQTEFCVKSIDRLQILCGDFFALQPSDLGSIDAVYDRAALVALPPDMRVGYVTHLANLLPANTQILLIVFDYAQDTMPGPPFSVDRAEIERLFGHWCDIELLASEDVLSKEILFKQRGLTRMEENIYRLRVA